MPWPTVPIVTTGMDSDTDTLPRGAILDHAQKFNQLIAMRGTADGVCDLGADGIVPAVRLPPGFPSGTAMLFAQTAAPVGWTKSTTHNNKALRVVNGTAGSGGTHAFSTIFAAGRYDSAVTVTGWVGGTTLTVGQMPSHSHNLGTYSQMDGGPFNGWFATGSGNATSWTGGNESHAHGLGTNAHNHAMDMDVQYVDVIIAIKD
jgi:hypothetical protein